MKEVEGGWRPTKERRGTMQPRNAQMRRQISLESE